MFPKRPLPLLASMLLLLGLVSHVARADEGPYRFTEGESGKGRLAYINGVPVLVMAGTPVEMGEQSARLAGDAGRELVDFPKNTLESRGRGSQWPTFRTMVQIFQPKIPPAYLEEIKAISKETDISVDRIVAANVLPDVYRAFGCSSLIVDAEHSATGGPLFARNLDFFTLDKLQKYDLVTVVRPEGKHAFVAVGFPGLIGVLSGMNEKGLALAVHEVPTSKDGAAMVNWLGVPYTMAFRRILEECETVAEARKLLEEIPRTTKLNLAVCDRETSAVLELTPRTVALRPGENGLTICTNHFRSEQLRTEMVCERFDALSETETEGGIDVETMQKRLHAANQGEKTLQSMIFEPRTLKLHVALIGQPSSAGPYRTLELQKLLVPDGDE